MNKLIGTFWIWSMLVMCGLLVANCNITIPDEEKKEDKKDNENPENNLPYLVSMENLFPFENSSNQWTYSDDGGNQFKVSVVDTISDENETYFKVTFVEKKLNVSQDNWFRKGGDTVEFSPQLIGNYVSFIPTKFNTAGGEYYSGLSRVNYSLIDTLELRGKKYFDVIELRFSRELLHGFDKIYFANNFGIIRFIDDDGRWPIEYVLDSARINNEWAVRINH